MSIDHVVHLTVSTPDPGTETDRIGRQLTTLDYRLFDIQHAVLLTRLPLTKFYESWSRPRMS
jgi:magnesium-protoporphyrin IX monomethyl ester (oxidative) cyclase